MIFFIIWRDVWQIYSHTGSNCNFLGLSFTCNIPPEKSRNDSFLLTLTLSWLFFIYCTNTHVIGIDITHYFCCQKLCKCCLICTLSLIIWHTILLMWCRLCIITHTVQTHDVIEHAPFRTHANYSTSWNQIQCMYHHDSWKM